MAGFGDFANFAGQGAAGFVSPSAPGLLSPLTDLVTSFTATLKKLTEPFEKITDLAAHFVQNIDPAILNDLNRKFRDLNATVGLALRPIIDTTREIVKYLSDRLLPIMRQLQPLVEKISSAVGGALMDAIDNFAKTAQAMMPTFQQITEVLTGVVRIVMDINTALIAFGRFISELATNAMGGMKGSVEGVRDFMDKLRQRIQELIGTIIMFVARLMLALGFADSVKALLKSLERGAGPAKKDESGGLAVALNPMFKSISDLSRSIQQEAFAASSGSTGKRPDEAAAEFLGNIAADLKKLIAAGDKDSAINQIKTAIKNIETKAGEIKTGAMDIKTAIVNGFNDALKWAEQYITRPVTKIWDSVLHPLLQYLNNHFHLTETDQEKNVRQAKDALNHKGAAKRFVAAGGNVGNMIGAWIADQFSD
jgi:phage-related protein